MRLSIIVIGLGFPLLSYFAVSQPVVAQDIDPIECAIPISLTRASNELTSSQEALQVTVQWGKLRTSVRAVADRNPRRIVVVLDDSKYITDDLWKLEASLASALFEGARKGDLLALYVISDQAEALGFSVPRDAQLGRVKELLSSRPAYKKERRRIYDALLAASDLLGTPRFADTIFYLGGGIDHDSASGRDATARVLLGRGIRLFGVLFRGLSFGYPAVPVQVLPPDLTAVGLIELSEQSGGSLEYESTEDAQHEFKFSTEALKSAWVKVARAHWQATTVYRLDLTSLPPPKKPSDLRLLLPASGSARLGETGFLYPRQKWACPSRSS